VAQHNERWKRFSSYSCLNGQTTATLVGGQGIGLFGMGYSVCIYVIYGIRDMDWWQWGNNGACGTADWVPLRVCVSVGMCVCVCECFWPGWN